MIKDKYKKFFLNIENIYFAKKIVKSNADITIYHQCIEKGLLNVKFISPIIDLSENILKIEENFRKSLRNEIKYANKNYKIDTKFEPNICDNLISDFRNFYGPFSRKKSIPDADYSKLERLKENIIITFAKHEDKYIVWHLYLADTKKLRLLYSASLLSENKDEAKLIIRANKMLHYRDIVLAKEKGFLEYDLGGVNLNDKKCEGINKFKFAFSKDTSMTNNFIIANTFPGKILLLFSRILGRN
ncbi:MAG: hypothetical protein CMK44_04385 [Porticoccus sp.]|jgi:lipid II:glycine glycyltransferase (peptidoglycan interpeptide bridge formation enzyme)|nr:hypothetical protein [Porticoccus sp.]